MLGADVELMKTAVYESMSPVSLVTLRASETVCSECASETVCSECASEAILTLTPGAAKLGPDLPACQLCVVAETDPDCLTIICQLRLP